MGRVFRRGELKQAVLVVLDSAGEAHGYGIMGLLKERVGGAWKPSPGAIYPALLALVDQGLVETFERDGTTMYTLTRQGQQEARASAIASRWASLSDRSERVEERVTIGSVLDEFAAGSPLRRRLAGKDLKREIESILGSASEEIEQLMNEGEDDG